ncbi:MAG: class II glutamine amidotransferase [Candidatus Bathyarchaeia archaeon]|jgi:predicted glutamine amidotransferase
MVSPYLPKEVVMNQLVSLPDSLKNLGGGPDGPGNVNGWGLIYYASGTLIVARGQPEAYTDIKFDAAAQTLASSGAGVGMGHVRNAASGAVNIPDPHPFIRVRGDITWTLAHNGGLNIANLKTLIGPTYLSYFTPTVGSNWNDPNVVDSDLYLIYIIKCVEDSNGNVKAGIAKAETQIYATDSSSNANFLLSDGTTMWGYKKSVDSSHPLCYKYDASQQYSAIASQPPEGSGLGNWITMNNFNLVEISAESTPVLYQDIRTYPLPDFTISASPSTSTVTAGGSVTSTMIISALNGFTGTVTLTASSQFTTTLTPSSLPGYGTSVMIVTIPASTIAGTYPIAVTGTSGSLIHSTTINVNVQTTTTSLLSATVKTDKSSYSRGQTVSITVSVMSGGIAVRGASVSVKVKNPGGSTLTYSATTDQYGNAMIKYKLSIFAQKGTYTVTATASKTGYQSASASNIFKVT